MEHRPNPFESRPFEDRRSTRGLEASLLGVLRIVRYLVFPVLAVGYMLYQGPVLDRAREIQKAEPVLKNRPLWLQVMEDLELVPSHFAPEPGALQTGPPPPLPPPKLRPLPKWSPSPAVSEHPFGRAMSAALLQAGAKDVVLLDVHCPAEEYCLVWGTGTLPDAELETLPWTPSLRTYRDEDRHRPLHAVRHPSSWEREPPFIAIADHPEGDAYRLLFTAHSEALRRRYEAGEVGVEVELSMAAEPEADVPAPVEMPDLNAAAPNPPEEGRVKEEPPPAPRPVALQPFEG